MKMMRALAAALLTVVLAGCGASDVPEPLPTFSVPEKEPVSLTRCQAWDETGLYRVDQLAPGSANLFFLDFAARKEVVLCERPECSHQDESCVSYFANAEQQGQPAVCLLGDQLVLWRGADDEPGRLCFWTAGRNGQNRRILWEASDNMTMSGELYTDGQRLYFLADTAKKETAETVRSLYALSASDGTMETLYSWPPEKGWFVSLSEGGPDCLYLYDAGYDTTTKQYNSVIYRFDLATKVLEKVYSRNDENEVSMMQGQSRYVLDRENQKITQYAIPGGEAEHTVSLAGLVAGEPAGCQLGFALLEENLWKIESFGSDENGEPYFHWYFFNMETGSFTPMTLLDGFRNQPIQIVGQSGQELCALIDYQIRTVDLLYEGVVTPVEVYRPVYAMIRREDWLASNPAYIPVESLW